MADNSNTLQLTLQVKDDGSVVIDTVKGKIEGLGQTTNKSGSGIGSTLSGLKSNWIALAAGVTAGYLAIKGGIDTITDLVNIAAEAEQIESRMAFQLGQVGYKFDEIKPFVDSFADSILKTTRFSDEMARQGLGQMMQYTSDVNQAMQGTKLAMDMSTQSGQDLNSTTRLVGMAMNGNSEILGRWIPELRDLESKVGANATAAEKWAYTQDLLNKKFGGAAQKDLQTYAGQVAQFKNELDELKETAGRGLLPYAQDWVLGAKSILADIFPDVGKGKETEKANLEEAKRKAAEQALDARAKRQYELELSMRVDIEKLDTDYQKKFLQLSNDKVGLIRLERDEALKAAQEKYAGIFTAETAIQKIKDVYLRAELEQIKANKKAHVDAVESLATMWKGYYDERISKENEVIALIKGSGVSTTIGAKFEFAGVEEQFRKIAEKSPMLTKDELEQLKAAYLEKIKGILPFQGGEWEEFIVPTGKEMGAMGPRTTYGTDKRWREGAMDEQQRQVELMREASLKRMEDMFKAAQPGAAYGTTAGMTGITDVFDESRNRVLELQREIDKIHEVKIAVESRQLIETINQVADLRSELTDITSRVWNISVDISGEEIARNIEQQLVSRFQNKQSPLGSLIEEGR